MRANFLTPLAWCGLLFGGLLFALPASAQESPEKVDPTEVVLRRPRLVNAATERAIEKGMKWLVRHQGRDGSFREGAQGMGGAYPTAMTALAGMAFLGHGDTPTRGRYANNVRRCVRFLLHPRMARRNGLITSPGEEGRSMYGHGFATMFLACAMGETGDIELEARMKRVLEGAIRLTSRAQSKLGGWYYSPESTNDEGSVTVTQVQALRACQRAGLPVPQAVLKKAVKYIELSANADGGIAYSAAHKGSSQPAISAAACAVLYNAGQYDSPMAKKCLDYVRRVLRPGSTGGMGHFYYTHLYLSQAYYQAGPKDFDPYYKAIAAKIVSTQAGDGSWQGDGVGKVYGTGIAVTILTLPYQRIPLYMR
ncbi:MAG: terpene cyclase/mutase family protein [Planctomycetes bacterium]|nr:terpene cyclase/mutase family protein [Planctomycetota bacterium]